MTDAEAEGQAGEEGQGRATGEFVRVKGEEEGRRRGYAKKLRGEKGSKT